MDEPAQNPAVIDRALDSRSASFENPTGGRGAGGAAHGGRKGAPSRTVAAGERVVLADVQGPGILRRIWMTFLPAPPEVMRSLAFEVFYDAASEPSVSVPCLDFFGLPHGRPVAYHSALTAANEGRGFNATIPMPFRQSARVELANHGATAQIVYYQIDYTLQPVPDDHGYLHVSWRRQNPTVMQRDFVITEGLVGPGRFLGCNIGVRVLDAGDWYGEGEVKVYRDGDDRLPTICGTGLEDYVGTAWGLGPHHTPLGGAPLVVAAEGERNPTFVGFYRWHLPDPILFESDLRVTIQQIGAKFFGPGEDAARADYERTHPVAGAGWTSVPELGGTTFGICERVDDYCATAFVYCMAPQAVPRLDVGLALADIGLGAAESAPVGLPLGLADALGA